MCIPVGSHVQPDNDTGSVCVVNFLCQFPFKTLKRDAFIPIHVQTRHALTCRLQTKSLRVKRLGTLWDLQHAAISSEDRTVDYGVISKVNMPRSMLSV